MAELRALAALGLVASMAGSASAGAGPDRGGEVAFYFHDRAIVESSGLAVVDALVATTNDSGDSGQVFVVDPGSGETVGLTSWGTDPTDVEALAPAGPGHVWVGDIGDNSGSRDTIEVSRVPVGRGHREVHPVSYELAYPGGGRDAEALLVHPVTGRLLVVTKGLFAGEVLQAPAALRTDRPNLLRTVASTPGLVTDGAFLPIGGAVVLRTYGRALAYSYPAWKPLADWALPEQQQGEGLAVDGTDLLLSSEGAGSAVLRVPIPPQVLAADLWDGPWGLVLRWLQVLSGA